MTFSWADNYLILSLLLNNFLKQKVYKRLALKFKRGCYNMGRRTRRSKTNTTFFLDITEEDPEKGRKWKKTDKWKSPWV